MSPRIQITPAAFRNMLNRTGGTVMHRPKRLLESGIYLAKVDDYYYFCKSGAPLTFSSNVSVSECLGVLL